MRKTTLLFFDIIKIGFFRKKLKKNLDKMNDVCYNGSIRRKCEDALVTGVFSEKGVKMEKTKNLLVSQETLRQIEREETLRGLKNVAYLSYIEGMHTDMPIMAAACALLSLALGFFQVWGWRSIGNIIVAAVFCGFCYVICVRTPRVRSVFARGDLRYRFTVIGKVIYWSITAIISILSLVIIAMIVILGGTSSPIGYFGWTILKLAVLAACGFLIRKLTPVV